MFMKNLDYPQIIGISVNIARMLQHGNDILEMERI